jgi:hypothetical protein
MAAKHLIEKNPMTKQFLKKQTAHHLVSNPGLFLSYHHRIQVPHLPPISQFACSYINLKCSFLLQVIHSQTPKNTLRYF